MESKLSTLPALFEQSTPPDMRKVLYFDLNGQEISYAIFYNRVELVTEMLKRQKIRKGDIIAILSDNLANWACAYFAVARTGAIALPLMPEMTDHDLTLFLNAHEVQLAFTCESQKQRLMNLNVKSLTTLIVLENFALEKLPEDRINVQEKLGREFEKFKKAAREFIGRPDEEETVEIEPNDPFCILYVPDTQNQWRQIYLTHQNITSAAAIVADRLSLKDTHRIAVFLPLSLTLPALLGIMVPLLVNAQAVLLIKPQNTRQLQNYLQQFNPTHLFTDSAFAEWVFKGSKKAEVQETLLKRSLRVISRLVSGVLGKSGKTESLELKKYHWLICTNFVPLGKQFKQYLQKQKIEHQLMLGNFETASVFLTGQANDEFCWIEGKILPEFDWDIASAQPKGDSGELRLKGPMVSVNKVEQNEQNDGYLHTGWLARKTDGTLQILGRKESRIVLPDGKQIFPELIEATLNEYDWVADSMVYLESNALFVRLYPDPEKAGELSRQYPERLAIELLQNINKTLPSQAQLKGVSIEDEPFKKNIFGQILREGQSNTAAKP